MFQSLENDCHYLKYFIISAKNNSEVSFIGELISSTHFADPWNVDELLPSTA